MKKLPFFHTPLLLSIIFFMMSGAKAPNYDTYELFRAMHFHNSPHYSHIVGLSSLFYAHIGNGSQGLSTSHEQAHAALDLLPWYH